MGGKGGEIVEYGDGVAWIRGSMIGKGSFGCVYMATLRNPRSRYSYYPPVMAVKSAEVSSSGSIQKEREVLSNVKGCNDIIRCFGEETTIGKNGSMVFNLLLEYGSGGTLAERIKKSEKNGLPECEAKVFVRSLLRGLKHIHGAGYVHCDLKPDNILLVPGPNGIRAKIGDFGSAKRAEQSKKRKLDPYLRGTPIYLSPEAVIDNVQEAPSDIWALGCIVLEMLTGKAPWSEKKELSCEDLLKKIGEGRESPIIPNGISKDARDFMKVCFVRKSMYRFTADMLLHHPFVEGLVEGDGVEEEEEKINEIESMLVVSDSDCEFTSSSYEDGEDSCSDDWSDEDGEEEITSQEIEVEEEEISGLNRPSKKARQRCFPVSFTVPAAV